MRLPILVGIVSIFLSSPAHAGVVVSWSPGVVAVNPYDPGYRPDPRPDYQWVPGWYDEFGNFVPGHWQPIQPNPGYVWSWGYWSGSVYHDGYWRPATRAGQTWIDGYYIQGRYVSPRWVRSEAADRARAQAHSRAAAHSSSRDESPSRGKKRD